MNSLEPRSLSTAADDVKLVLEELIRTAGISAGKLIVIGTSTSEVIGERIGTAGAAEAAERIFQGVEAARKLCRFFPAFQCCEHLNRALVLEREALSLYPDLEEVSVVPVPRAGGSMAAWAYLHLKDPVVVETIQAHAGLDIGETMIGMHLRKVAVPLRPSLRWIGHARVSMAYSRPKLIGGARAQYSKQEVVNNGNCL
nr:TIGR01440 family protein [Paenibacillus senegalensis]